RRRRKAAPSSGRQKDPDRRAPPASHYVWHLHRLGHSVRLPVVPRSRPLSIQDTAETSKNALDCFL
ncbi:hypothetical protein FRC00_004443, partial [Tulasnella sp. 408]